MIWMSQGSFGALLLWNLKARSAVKKNLEKFVRAELNFLKRIQLKFFYNLFLPSTVSEARKKTCNIVP